MTRSPKAAGSSDGDRFYKKDLAHIHDLGFSEYAVRSAPGILGIFRRNGINGGLVVDLGCGSGLWAALLTGAKYRVIGIDASPAMIRIAHGRAPAAEFRVGSLYRTVIPQCAAVTSVGECLNYAFASGIGLTSLTALFHRVHKALDPGGLFIFDLATPGQVPRSTTVKTFTEGNGWMVAVEKQEDHRRAILTRRIITFTKRGKGYRRDEELHRLRLYSTSEVVERLERARFKVTTGHHYGTYRLPPAHVVFIARKQAWNNR